MKIIANIDAAKILKHRGLQPNGPVQQMFTHECAKAMDHYVPMQTGTLKNTRFIGVNYVKYTQPYARYQYHGVLYVDPQTGLGCFYDHKTGRAWSRKGVRKVPSDRDLTYHGAPMRGKQWDIRMWADHKCRLMQMVARACGGKVK